MKYKTYKELNKEIDRRHYNNIVGLSAEITETDYFHFLEVLPPIFVKGGFLLMEYLTHDEKGPVTLLFQEKGNKYNCEVVHVYDYVSQKDLIKGDFI